MIEPGRAFQKTISDDLSGGLSAGLSERIDGGKELLSWAQIVISACELEQWQRQRQVWRRQSAAAIAVVFEQEAVDEFLYATASVQQSGDWSAWLQTATRGVLQGVELLDSLRGSLSARGISAKGRPLAPG
jgi:hypothetical protein